MSQTIKKTYTDILNEVSGKNWKKDKTFRVGHAGVAITVSFLENGSLKLKTLIDNALDFSQTELRIALKALKENGYFEKNKKGEYRLSVGKDENLEGQIFWGLLINVAQGYLKRRNTKYVEKKSTK